MPTCRLSAAKTQEITPAPAVSSLFSSVVPCRSVSSTTTHLCTAYFPPLHQSANKMRTAVSGCSATSTAGGSMGYTDTTDRECEAHPSIRSEGACLPRSGPSAYCTLLLNGVQTIRCPYPEVGSERSVTVAAQDLNVSGEVGGMGLDILFTSSHHSYSFDNELRARLVAADDRGQVQEVSIGGVQYSGETAHLSYHLRAIPVQLTLTVSHQAFAQAAESAAEKQFVRDVGSVLRNPRLNREGGSLNAILLNSKAKESVLYDEIVGGIYNGVWLDFVRHHSREFTLFQYNAHEIKARELSPHIKKGDARIYLSSKTLTEVHRADQLRSRRGREGEAELERFMSQTLRHGSISQKDLLTRLRDCTGFTALLFPTLTLLMRFLSKHKDIFVWLSEPDQPTRIGLNLRSRRSCHETGGVFTGARVLPMGGAQRPLAPTCRSSVGRPYDSATYCHDPYSHV